MCPACLASMGMLVAAGSSAAALTALVAAKIRRKKPDAMTQSTGETHEPSGNRIQE
jgi:hypothetical protein